MRCHAKQLALPQLTSCALTTRGSVIVELSLQETCLFATVTSIAQMFGHARSETIRTALATTL